MACLHTGWGGGIFWRLFKTFSIKLSLVFSNFKVFVLLDSTRSIYVIFRIIRVNGCFGLMAHRQRLYHVTPSMYISETEPVFASKTEILGEKY